MIADFKISKSGTSGILIEGTETQYTAENGVRFSLRQYTYSDTITLNALVKVSASGLETFQNSAINLHCTTCVDSTSFGLTKDGLYLINHLIIPNDTWFNYVISGYENELNTMYDFVFYYNTTDGKFYKYSNGTSAVVTIAEILVADHDTPDGTDSTTIVRADKNTFVMYKLNDCFNSVCKDILIALPNSPCVKSSTLSAKMYERDVMWMGINVIKYYIEQIQLFEAQRILETLTACNLCEITSNTSNCGCNS